MVLPPFDGTVATPADRVSLALCASSPRHVRIENILQELGIAMHGRDGLLLDALCGVLMDLHEGSGAVSLADATVIGAGNTHREDHPDYAVILGRALAFFTALDRPVVVRLVLAGSFQDLKARLIDAGQAHRDFCCSMCIVDADAIRPTSPPRRLEDELDNLYESIEAVGGETLRSPYSNIVFRKAEQKYPGTDARRTQITRLLPDRSWVAAAELLTRITDYADQTFCNPFARRKIKASRSNPLAAALTGFLSARVAREWTIFYYPGSIMGDFISSLEEESARLGIPALRGPNEHSLAAAAIAYWAVEGKAFLIAVTTGMSDEFKGTLMNLRAMRARGFILVAEYGTDKWFGFQGSINHEEDLRAVLDARRIPWIYLDSVATAADRLKDAYALYDSEQGPVFLLVTQSVLEATVPFSQEPYLLAPPPAPDEGSPASHEHDKKLIEVVRMVNEDEIELLWVCGALNDAERSLAYSIARRAGIGLADTIIHPGSVARYVGGHRVEEYLGTSGLYGYSREFYDFVHENGRLKSKGDLCVFFLKSRITMAEHPFSDAALANKLRIVQVTKTRSDLCPFADVAIETSMLGFLTYLDRHLRVRPSVAAWRRRHIKDATSTIPQVAELVPTLPMTTNYFFARFRSLLVNLIEEHGYGYTGVYDVGRAGLSAMRNLPRTGRGFSGWYGRALMGDALAAAPYLALSQKGNVIAFVGDGAKQIVPDILPALIENITSGQAFGNLTIFFFLNDQMSILNSYSESIRVRQGGRHLRTVNLDQELVNYSTNEVDVDSFLLDDFDEDRLRAVLCRQSAVNLVSVRISHNNLGDGMTLSLEKAWHYAAA